VFGALCAYTDRVRDFDRDEIQAFEVLASQAAVGIQTARLHGELIEKKVMEREMELAERVQNNFMPPQDMRVCGKYDICARTSPCWQIGGDFYDLVEFGPNHFGAAIGDVSGKGIGASILMATTRSALRAHIENVYPAREIVAKVNHGLVRDTGVDQFVSLFYMVAEPSGLVTYVNGGHCPPMLFRGDERITLNVGGPILGVANWVQHKEGRAQVEPGDIILMYTDGMTETFSAFGEEFGARRLCDVVAAHRALPCEQLAEALYREVDAYSGHQPPTDDRTLVLIKVR
jgi:serine phosphatase RsbU (regulator of sigma subunit)